MRGKKCVRQVDDHACDVPSSLNQSMGQEFHVVGERMISRCQEKGRWLTVTKCDQTPTRETRESKVTTETLTMNWTGCETLASGAWMTLMRSYSVRATLALLSQYQQRWSNHTQHLSQPCYRYPTVLGVLAITMRWGYSSRFPVQKADGEHHSELC